MNAPPLTVVRNDPLDCYGIDGWEELNRWAMMNSAVWKVVNDQCDFLHIIDPAERLKLLCAALLDQAYRANQIAVDAVRRSPMPSGFSF